MQNLETKQRTNSCPVVGSVSLWGTLFGKKGWKLYDLESKEIFVSHDVEFFKDILPFSTTKEEKLRERGARNSN